MSCDGNARVCGIRAGDLAIIRQRARELHAIREVIRKARLVSPSPSMTVYVAELERALGMDVPVPHKVGGNG